MGKHQLTIHDHHVYGDDERSYYGIKHLAYELTEDESQELFKQAEAEREVDFEDKDHRKFTLVYNHDNAYIVVAEHQTGWF